MAPPRYNPGTGSAVVTLVPTTAPQDTATRELVDEIRAQAAQLRERTGAAIAVTGSTAISADASERLADSLVPFLAVLFGLAMDYGVFLVSSMREEWVRTGQPRAVLAGAGAASRVVTAAALIMFSVFASFVTTEDAVIKPIALALAVGVLVDAFVVRMTFVPAVLTLVGRGAWRLPRWLDRLLPSVDIEGDRLRHSDQLAPAITSTKE
ncbi:MMPL family transporter [Saccharomonospora sp. NPDC046836]|uniref:MMPL family transporter n=1 Tax=Saccharomonospora sp. NPDC046836 TaxID=3156921 RepID=UPI0033F6295A